MTESRVKIRLNSLYSFGQKLEENIYQNIQANTSHGEKFPICHHVVQNMSTQRSTLKRC